MVMTLKELRQARADKLANLEKIASDAGETFTDEQQKSWDEGKKDIESIDAQIKRAEDLIALKATTAVPMENQMRTDPVVPAAAKEKMAPGVGFARIVRALAATKGIPEFAAQYADKTWGTDGQEIAKALQANNAVGGGFLIPEVYSQEMIQLLRNQTIVRRAGAVSVPMPGGNLLMPKIAGGATANWIGEGQNIKTTETSFGQLRMSSRTLAALVPISNQLIRYSNPQADNLIRDDLVTSMGLQEDATYLRDQGIGAAPRGMRYWIDTGNIRASAGTTAVNIENDLKFCVNALTSKNVRMVKPVWLMSPRSYNHLWTLRTTQEALVFPEVRSGTLWGYPIYMSNQIPSNLGGGANETEIYFVDMNDCIIGEDQGITVDVSDVAAYHDGSSVQAPFSLDQTVIRALMRVDFAMRYDFAGAVVTGVTWGAT